MNREKKPAKKFKIQGSHLGHTLQITFMDPAGFYHVYVNKKMVASVQTVSDALGVLSSILKKEEN